MRVPPHIIRAATSVLIGLGIVLIGMTIYLFANLRDRQEAVLASVREDAMWAVFQTHREATRFIEAILIAQKAGTPQAIDRVYLTFDLVYSRMTLLDAGFFSERFSDSQILAKMALALQADIQSLADRIDATANTPAVLVNSLNSLLDDARELQQQSNGLVIATNDILGTARAVTRAQTSSDYGRLATVVGLTGLVFICTIILQFVQLRIIANAQRQLKELSLRNAESAKAAQAATNAKSMFLATMSHEIRTPLNGIIGAVDLLDDTHLNPAQARLTLTIRRSGHILLDAINDILDFSNLNANGLTYQVAPVSLPDLADILHDVFQQRLNDAGLTLTFDVQPLIVATDDVRLRQVLVNLIGNAIKFTPSGTIVVRFLMSEDTTLRIEVTDSGIGIPQADLAKLFQNFSQIENSSSRRFGGTGLGLAISKRIVEGLGGAIGVVSTEGQGSTFWLELPVDIVGPAETRAVNALDDRKERRLVYRSTILLVEDHPINQEVARALFESFGATVVTAGNGQSAIEHCTKAAFDFAVMDLQMPLMDGITATRKLRDLGFTIPIIGLTANAFAEDRQRCLDAGMDDFLAKPVTRSKIAYIFETYATPAEPAQTGNLLDAQQLDAIRDELGTPLLLELLGQISSDGFKLRSFVAVEQPEGDDDCVDAALHSLKGAASTLGLTEVAKRAQEMRHLERLEHETVEDFIDLITKSIAQAEADSLPRR
ncbi:ATP-binding protein [Loktanella sp. 5RATIMAR09]|uniref:ATP-binding protein n=1 Tax=Loktanella sp. 5RATIMAR09 TaxID=1225655 RepID=UPI0012ED6472|nr:ATP-binding protein [Loktanella sp. 5RATIMAR09]